MASTDLPDGDEETGLSAAQTRTALTIDAAVEYLLAHATLSQAAAELLIQAQLGGVPTQGALDALVARLDDLDIPTTPADVGAEPAGLSAATKAAQSATIVTEVSTEGAAARDALDELYLRSLSVRSFGAGQGGADDTTAFLEAAQAADALGVNVHVPRGDYTVSGTVDLSDLVRPLTIHVEKGAVITQTANAPAFKAAGAFGAWVLTTSNTTRGTRTCTVADASGFSIGDWIAISSSNTATGGADKIGYLRRITGLTATVITFDSSVPRSLFTAQSAHVQAAAFVPRISIIGGGQIKHADASNFTTLIDFTLCQAPRVGVEIGPSGGPGVTFSHCLGGGTDADFWVHDLTDDEAGGHFGYGINLAGSSRDMRFLGLGERCRHAITTNVGPNVANSNQYGEPESNVVDMETRDCTNKALDTHRPGWGNVFRPNHTGGAGGGVQIRADNTDVRGGVISGPNSVGIAVASVVTIPGSIDGVNITGVAGTAGIGILLEGPAIVSNPKIYGFTGTGIKIVAPGCIVSNPYIDGVSAGVLVGIDVQSNDNLLTFGRIKSVGTGIKLAAGVTGNQYGTVTFGGGVTTPTVGP